jgi:hypothetical protein
LHKIYMYTRRECAHSAPTGYNDIKHTYFSFLQSQKDVMMAIEREREEEVSRESGLRSCLTKSNVVISNGHENCVFATYDKQYARALDS